MKRFAFLALCSVITACSSSAPPPDNATIVVYSRHTFRGISKTIGPQKIALPEYGIDVSIPNLSYGEDATPRGMAIAEDYASAGLQKAAVLAVDALGEAKRFDGHWDEIRADLSTERTFWTALHLRDGLVAQHHRVKVDIPVTGCPTKPGKGVDAVSIDKAVKECIPDAVYKNLLASSPDLKKLQSLGQIFLNSVRESVGLTDPVALPEPVYSPEGQLPKAYESLAELASITEMSAELAPPLGQIFKNAPKGPLLQFGKPALSQGLETLGIRFFTGTPSPMSDAVSVHPLQYMASRPKGSHTVVLSHDDFISALTHALGLISSDGDPDELAMYPIETFVFAFGDQSVSVVRMRIQVRDADGAIPGPYASQVVWKGTRAQWDEKVDAVNQRARSWDIGDEGDTCLKAITICTAEKIDAAF